MPRAPFPSADDATMPSPPGVRVRGGRLAFGGRASYYFGSRKRRIIPREDPLVANVEGTLRSLFPILDGYRVTHGWGGFMGVPRHWRTTGFV